MKKQKGITLIALIITIIVMLILVGVTINVALNGGVFDTANKATSDTEKHLIYDQILGVMKLTDNGTINVKETHSNAEAVLGNQGMITSQLGADGIFTVTGKIETYKYKITETEIIIDPEEISNEWIKRGLSPKYQYGKWYGYTEVKDGVETVRKWFVLYADGSYSQDTLGRPDSILNFPSQEMDQMLGTAITVSGNDFIANGNWKVTLNESDGTAILIICDKDTGEYNYERTILLRVIE